MNKILTLIVDDEPPAREGLRIITADFPEIKIIGEAANLDQAVDCIQNQKPDLVLLDIELAGESGFDLFERVKVNFPVVFVTAWDHYAIRAFEINALDYLLKPVSRKRFAETLKRLHKPKAPRSQQLDYADRIYINDRDRYHFIPVNRIKAICAQGDYTQIFVSDQEDHWVLKSLKAWETQLPEKHFFRIHRSTIINLDSIKQIEKGTSNTCLIHLKDMTKTFQMSQRHTTKFRERNILS